MRNSTPSRSGSNGSTSGTALYSSERYEFGSVVVRGRTGVLHRGRDTKRNETILLKLLRPSGEGRSRTHDAIERKASTLCRIDHPHIAPVRDFGRHHGLSFVASDAVEGISLDNYLERFGPLRWSQFAPCFRALLDGLAEAHAHGIVHGDVQPSHIVLTTRSGTIEGLELVGFGFPDLVTVEQQSSSNQTALASDIDAVAPERIERKAVDQRVDLYALGETAYQMLAGRPPFEGDDFHFLFQHVHDDPPPLAELVPGNHEIPEPIVAFIDTLLAKEPSDRPHDAKVARQWLCSNFEAATSVSIGDLRLAAANDRRSSAEATSEDIDVARPGSTDSSEPSTDPSPEPPDDWTGAKRIAQLLGGVLLFAACLGGGWYAVVGLDDTETAANSTSPPDGNTSSPKEAPDENREPLETKALFAKIDNAIDDRRFGTAHSLLDRLKTRLHERPELQKRASSRQMRLRIAETFERAKRLEDKFKIEQAMDHYRQILTVQPGHTAARTRLDKLLDSIALRVESNVKAAVYVDGRPQGITPMSELVAPETSEISVRRRGYTAWSTTLEADGGTTVDLTAKLEEASYEGGTDRSGGGTGSGSSRALDDLMKMEVD